MSRRVSQVAAIAALAWAGALGAHHSESMFEMMPEWVKGSVVEFARVNPHSVVTVEETTADGSMRRWLIEGHNPGRLDQRGFGPDYLQPGDHIEFCAFPMTQRFSTAPEGGLPFSHGLVLVLPDGQMQIWGSYGRMSNCVTPDDDVARWVEFLDSNDIAWVSWCRRFMRVPSREDSQALVDEINDALEFPCTP